LLSSHASGFHRRGERREELHSAGFNLLTRAG
jgi:hypothetical protein